MNRRKTLKTLAIGGFGASTLINACKTDDKPTADKPSTASSNTNYPPEGPARQPEEIERYKEITAKTFFTPAEMATITVLSDIIIPKDEISGSATEAKVPDFIEFIVKDKPEFQIPLRGGLRWLDVHCLDAHQKPFKDCSPEQQIAVIDLIAYPKKAKPEHSQGVNFFNLIRNLTATGFYTSAMGIKDIGFKGNTPNQWAGVPDEVLKELNMAYTEKEMKECI